MPGRGQDRILNFVVLEIVQYGHPILREKGKRIEKISSEIHQLAKDMVETMHAANGVGLAAQQIGRALQLTVVDVRGTSISSELWWRGRAEKVDAKMPLILLNPEIVHMDGEQIGAEGCLSIPDITADIRRAAKISVRFTSLDGVTTGFECTGLLARAAQHEIDHLNGILFTERMEPSVLASYSSQLQQLQQRTLSRMGLSVS